MQAGMEQLARAAGEARRAATESLATQLAELDRLGGHNRERRDDELASNRAQKRARRAAAIKLAGLLDGQEEPQQDPLLADENSHAGHHRHHQHHHHGHHHREQHDAGPHVRVVALDEPPSSVNRHNKIIFQEESEVLAKRLADLKVELYKRNDMLKAAEKVRQQREEEAVRAAAAEEEREARERAEAEAKARAVAEARAAQEKKAQEAVAAKQAEEASQRSVRDLIKLNMQRRAAYAARSKDVDDFVKRFKKMVNGCNLMIQMTGETVQDMKKLGYEGNRKNAGAGTFLSQLQAKKPELIDLGMHVVADRIIRFGTTQTAPDSIKAGETKFALVYLVVTLSINFEGFFERFMESMAHACPYMCPGLREAVIASADGADTDALRAKLGYSAGETNADYIARMQAHVGFLAGVYQTSVSMLSKAPYEMVPPGSKHPCKEGGGLVEAWRWLAMNANRAPNRWTPHLILAFVSVCGFELSRHFPTQMAKMLDLFASADFIDKCKAVAKMDLGDDDNDVDRYTTYTELFTSFAKSSKVRAPGREQDGQDVRQLVLQVASNQAL